MPFSRRRFLNFAAGAGAVVGTGAGTGFLRAQQTQEPRPPRPDRDPRADASGPQPYAYYQDRSHVSLVRGDVRRQNIHDALVAIDADIQPVLRTKKYVVIKPNNVSTRNPLAATNADALRGILDYLAPRFKGPVVIAESSAGETAEGYENFGYHDVVKEHASQNVKLVDLNEEARYKIISLMDYDLHVLPVRAGARLMDPDAFVICSAVMKTHNMAIATLSVKNMVLGAPLHQAPGETTRWNDKRKFHMGIRQSNYNMMLAARAMKPFWGATVIDGFEGMEGNGPGSGTPVDHRIAIASTDYIAADRVGVEAMGIDASWMGHLNYCHQVGVGQYDLSKIDIEGEKIASIAKKYRLHNDVERQLQWRGEMTELPPNLG